MVFTKNIHLAMRCSDGELVVELKRLKNSFLNQFLSDQSEIRESANKLKDKMDQIDELRMKLFDTAAQAVYVKRTVKGEEVREELKDDEGNVMTPLMLDEFTKTKVVMGAYELNGFYVKN